MNLEKEKRCLGPGATALFIPQFIFSASACKHDIKYHQGGGLIEKLYADFMFYAYMLKDIKNGKFKWYQRYFYLFTATLYLALVLIFGVLLFNWKWND